MEGYPGLIPIKPTMVVHHIGLTFVGDGEARGPEFCGDIQLHDEFEACVIYRREFLGKQKAIPKKTGLN